MSEFASSPPDISQQSDYTVLQISQEAIQNCDTSEYVTLLHGITDSLQSFEAAFQRYVLSVSGYDNDQRELYQIPEVVSFIKDLNSKLPFWLYFVNTGDKRFFSWMIACLCQAMSLDQDDETIYADFNADAYNDLIEYQTVEPKVVFHTIKQMSEQEWNEMTGTETKELNSVKALN